jgi:hypothetical protein
MELRIDPMNSAHRFADSINNELETVGPIDVGKRKHNSA